MGIQGPVPELCAPPPRQRSRRSAGPLDGLHFREPATNFIERTRPVVMSAALNTGNEHEALVGAERSFANQERSSVLTQENKTDEDSGKRQGRRRSIGSTDGVVTPL